MNKFYDKTKKADEIGVTVFAILFMTVGFLQASSLTFGKPIISLVQWPAVALGCLLLLERFISFKHYIKTRGIVLLILFALSHIVSMLWTRRYGVYINIRYLVFMVFQAGLLYATDSDRDFETSVKRLNICANYYLIGTAVLSVLSFVFMFSGYTKQIVPEGEGPVYYIGFVWGRLFGAYWDPNIAAVITVAAFFVSAAFAARTKNIPLKIVYILSAVIEFMYTAFSGSRTGIISLIGGALVYVLLMAFKHKIFKNTAAHVVSSVAIALIAVIAAAYAPKAIQNGYNEILLIESKHNNDNIPSNDSKTDITSKPEDAFARADDVSKNDISNRRFDIWKAAIEVFKTSPAVGVGRANILPYVDDNLPQSYLVTNDHMRFDSMHNMYLEILVSQGAVGLALFLAFMVWVIAGIVKNGKRLWESRYFDLFALIIAVCAVVCTSTLVMTEIVYVTSPISTLFWLAIGCINHYITGNVKEEK